MELDLAGVRSMGIVPLGISLLSAVRRTLRPQADILRRTQHILLLQQLVTLIIHTLPLQAANIPNLLGRIHRLHAQVKR